MCLDENTYLSEKVFCFTNDLHLHNSFNMTGRQTGATNGHDTERYTERVHGAEHLHLPTRAFHEDYWRYL